MAYYRPVDKYQSDKGMAFLSFDCDFRRDMEAIPKLLDLLDSFGLKAGFACVGRWIEEFPREHRLILEAGHEILNHTYSHPDNEELNPRRFKQLSPAGRRVEIERFTHVCKACLGYRPLGFRTPHFGPQHRYEVYQLLAEMGYRYSSSIASLGVPSRSAVLSVDLHPLLEFPLSSVPGYPRAAFDSWNYSYGSLALAKRGFDMVADFRKLVEGAAKPGGYLNVYFDPADAVGKREYKEMFSILQESKGNIRVLAYQEACGNLI